MAGALAGKEPLQPGAEEGGLGGSAFPANSGTDFRPRRCQNFVQSTGVSSVSESFSRSGFEVLNVVSMNGMTTQFDSMGGVHMLPSGALATASAFSPSGVEVLEVFSLSGLLTQFDSMGGMVQLPTFESGL